jgi:hypothetical protein
VDGDDGELRRLEGDLRFEEAAFRLFAFFDFGAVLDFLQDVGLADLGVALVAEADRQLLFGTEHRRVLRALDRRRVGGEGEALVADPDLDVAAALQLLVVGRFGRQQAAGGLRAVDASAALAGGAGDGNREDERGAKRDRGQGSKRTTGPHTPGLHCDSPDPAVGRTGEACAAARASVKAGK